MYQIICRDGTVLYDSSYPDNYLASEPHLTLEIGQPGNLSIALLPEHPAYSLVKGMETYLSVYRDGEELFYGRIIDIQTSKITGMKQIECAGAISFLDDGELPPLSKDGETMTAQQFFTRCINAYNSDIGTDAKRNMSVGTVSFSRKSKSAFYQINSYTKVKNAIESYVTNKYGGFLRFRRANDTQYIDWIGTTEQVDPSPITLTQNVVDQDNDISANDFVTRIRPVGKDNLTLPEGTIEVKSGLTSKYGRIIKTVNFSGAETESALRNEAQEYINVMPKGLGGNSDIKCIDMHYMDGSQPYIGLGVTYTNIAGFEGENMCVSNLEMNLANPAEDTVVLKNERELNTTSYQSTNKPAAGKNGGGRGGGGGGASGLFQNTWEHISETEKTLTFHADLISSHGIRIEETAQEFERYAQTNDAAMERIHGTGVFQNSDHITQVAGNYSIYYYRVPAAKVEGQNPKRHGWYEFDPAGITATEDMKDSGIELFSSVDYQNPGLNGKITATRVNSSDIVAGNKYYQFTKTNDETPGSGKSYYSRGVVVHSGSEFIQDEDGEEHNIWSEVKDAAGNVHSVLDSALWIKKDDITEAVGELDIVEDPLDPSKKTLVIKSGGGLKIRRDSTEFGVYDDGNLTGGIVVDKINNDGTVTTSTKIRGDLVDIQASQVRVGNTTNVQSWLQSQGRDIDNLEGLVADTITAYDAKFNTFYSESGDVVSLNCYDIDCSNVMTFNVDTDTIDCSGSIKGGGFYLDIPGSPQFKILDITKSNDGSTLNIKRYNGSTVDTITFEKATSGKVTLNGSWSSDTRMFTVYAVPSTGAIPSNVPGKVYGEIVPVGGTTDYDSDTKTISQYFKVFSEDLYSGDADVLLINQKLEITATKPFWHGKSTVALNDPAWTNPPKSSITASQNTVSVSTSGRTDASGSSSELSKSVTILTKASTSGLTATFYAYYDDSTDDNKRILKRTATCSDSKLTAANIKNGVSIFGVTGTYTGSAGSIDIPTKQIYTTSSYPSGTKLNVLRSKYETARADYDYVVFRVDCSCGAKKTYFMYPRD